MKKIDKKQAAGLVIAIALILIGLLSQWNKFGNSKTFSGLLNYTSELLDIETNVTDVSNTTTEEPTTTTFATTTPKPTTTTSATTTPKPTTTTSATTTPKPTTTTSTTTTKKPTTTTKKATTTTKKPTTTTPKPTTTTPKPTTTTPKPTTTTPKPTTTTPKPTTTTPKPTTTTPKPTTTTPKPTTTTRKPTTTTPKPTTTTPKPTTTTPKPTTTTPKPTTTTPKPTTTTSTTTTPKPTTRKPTAGPELYLTPFLNRNQIGEAQSRARVSHEGWNVESYAGYFTVNENNECNLFFWYFPAKVVPERAPVVLYVEGELGKTAALSIFVKNGPLVVDSTGQLVERADSWNNYHNMLYIDTAVDSGYSFGNRPTFAWTLEQVGSDVAEAVQQFFKLFPNLQRNDFFVAGESFAAPLVTVIANRIHKDYVNLRGSGRINLKGIAIGNGVIAPKYQFVFSDILYNVGLVDSNQRQEFQRKETRIRTLLKSLQSLTAQVVLGGTVLWRYKSLFQNVTGYGWQYNFHDTEPPAKYNHDFINWVNRTDVRKALHVGDNVFQPHNYQVENSLMTGVLRSEGDLFIDLLDHYRVLIYTGNLDIICSYSSVQNLFQHILHRATEFRRANREKWQDRRNKLAGYVKKSGNLVQVVVRNAGHFSSIDQPQRTCELLEDFTQGRL